LIEQLVLRLTCVLVAQLVALHRCGGSTIEGEQPIIIKNKEVNETTKKIPKVIR
jgi:hypothetical protein